MHPPLPLSLPPFHSPTHPTYLFPPPLPLSPPPHQTLQQWCSALTPHSHKGPGPSPVPLAVGFGLLLEGLVPPSPSPSPGLSANQQPLRFCVHKLNVQLVTPPPLGGGSNRAPTTSFAVAVGQASQLAAGQQRFPRFVVQREIDGLAAYHHPNVARILGYASSSSSPSPSSSSAFGDSNNNDSTGSSSGNNSSSSGIGSSGNSRSGSVDCLIYESTPLGHLEGILRRNTTARLLDWSTR